MPDSRPPSCLLLALALVGLAGCPPSDDDVVGNDDDLTSPDDDDVVDDDDAVDDDDSGGDDDDATGDPWQAVRDAIDASSLEDLTVMFGTADGTAFTYSKGTATPTDTLLIASASKWIASMTLLASVDAGILALDDRPQDHLTWWTSDPTDPRRDITLEQLLSFTAGFTGGVNDVPCVEDGDTTLDACAQSIHDDFFQYDPGTTFVYGPPHLQVAGAMVAAATGSTFNQVFRQRIGNPLGLALTTAFAVPSLANPRVAAGVSASAEDYATILTALVAGQLLSPASTELLGQDHTGAGVTMAVVPDSATEDGREWHYALGCWRECAQSPSPPACDDPGVLSSPGAFGFYPWWDQARGFWGVLAIQSIADGASATVPYGQQWSELAAVALGLE